MISVVLETMNDEAALARTLASLVPAAVEGVVVEVLVSDGGSTDGTEAVADQAGCVVLTGSQSGPVGKRARGDWLLLLQPGAEMVPGWIEPVRQHIAVSDRPAVFSRSRQTRRPILARLFGRRHRLADGLLVPKTAAAMPHRPVRLAAEIHGI